LFQRAADAMYKKYMTNESFRALTNPDRSRRSIVASVVEEGNAKKKKKSCC
jgi:hypothetical protein